MSRLESLIGWLSPEWAARREKARTRQMLYRAQYDMARHLRANDGWITPNTSANAEVGPALAVTRNRARDLVRNNPYAARIIDVWTAHLVGDGITAAWRAGGGEGESDKQRQQAWKAWADNGESDADGDLDFYGQQQLAVRTMVESGEVLIRKRIRRLSDGLTVPLQLQVMEPDHLDHTKNERLTNGGVILLGVQFSPIGRREGYWLYRNHPGDNTFAYQVSSVFVPADQIMHLFRKRRPGQVRGMTWLAPSGNKIRDLNEYHEALLMKARIEACTTGWIESPDEEDPPGLGAETTKTINGIQQAFQTMEPGTVVRMRPGEKITFSQPTSGGSHEAYTRQFEQAAAVGAGITVDQLNGDLSRANFSSLRAGKIEFRRDLSQIQWQALIPMLCEPVGRTFDMLGMAAGLWPDDGAKALWMPPRNEPIDPKKDTDAELAELEAGLESWSSTVSRRGHDPRTLAQQIAADDEMLAALGLERFTKGSTAAAAPPMPPSEENDDDQDEDELAAA